jgi:inner membrane protein
MGAITQVLAAVALARCGFRRVTPMAMAIIVTAAVAPCLDWLSVLGGARMFLEVHRTATDSLLGISILAAGIAGIFVAIGARTGKTIRFFPAFLAALAGGGVHLLLDLTNSYGVKLLWPFSARWFAWDLTAPIDPWIMVILLAGLLLPALFRMVTEEIGAGAKRGAFDRGAAAALVMVALFCCARFVLRQRAVALLAAREYHGEAANAAGAFPESLSPLEWSGVVDTDDTMDEVEVSLGPGAVFDPESARVFYKAEESAALDAARGSAVGAEFLRFARFPLARVEPTDGGYRITMRDLRFDSAHAERNVVAEIDVDASNDITRQAFLFNNEQAGAGEENSGEK